MHIRKQIGFFFSLPIFLAFAIHACVGFGSTSTPPLLCCRSASPVTRSKQLCYFPLRYMPFKHLIIYFPPLLPRDYVPLRCLMLPQIVPYLPSLCKAYTGKVSFLSNLYMCIFGMSCGGSRIYRESSMSLVLQAWLLVFRSLRLATLLHWILQAWLLVLLSLRLATFLLWTWKSIAVKWQHHCILSGQFQFKIVVYILCT
jgi:hypothetical protein